MIFRTTDEAIAEAARYLRYLSDRGHPFVRHLTGARLECHDLSDDGVRLLAEGYEDIDAGRVIDLDAVKREIGL